MSDPDNPPPPAAAQPPDLMADWLTLYERAMRDEARLRALSGRSPLPYAYGLDLAPLGAALDPTAPPKIGTRRTALRLMALLSQGVLQDRTFSGALSRALLSYLRAAEPPAEDVMADWLTQFWSAVDRAQEAAWHEAEPGSAWRALVDPVAEELIERQPAIGAAATAHRCLTMLAGDVQDADNIALPLSRALADYLSDGAPS